MGNVVADWLEKKPTANYLGPMRVEVVIGSSLLFTKFIGAWNSVLLIPNSAKREH